MGYIRQAQGRASAPWEAQQHLPCLLRRGVHKPCLCNPLRGRSWDGAISSQGALARPWADEYNPFGVKKAFLRLMTGRCYLVHVFGEEQNVFLRLLLYAGTHAIRPGI